MNEILIVYIPIFIISLIKVADSVLAKHFQNAVGVSLDVLIAFNLYNSIVACIYFAASDGFKIGINGITVIFSLVYAAMVGLNHMLTFLAYSKTSVSFVSVVSTAGSIVVSTMFGLIFLDEKPSLKLFVSLFLLVIAVIITALDLIRKKTKNSILILSGFFFVSGILIIITKLYSGNKKVCSSNSFFFLTNVVLLLLAVAFLIIKTKGNSSEIKRISRIFSFGQFANISSRNIICNISAILTVSVLKNTDLSIFSIITYSMMLIINLLVSKFYFKEEIKLNNIFAVALAILAIIINPI